MRRTTMPPRNPSHLSFIRNTSNFDDFVQHSDSTSHTTHSHRFQQVNRRCRSKRKGAAVVEFAIVAPLFFLLVLGMIEFGRMIMVQQVLTNASREGARVAILDGVTSDDVVQAVERYLQSAAIDGATIVIDPNPPSLAGYGEPVSVTVSVPFSQVSWLPTPIMLGNQVLSATTVMRRETVQ